MRLPTVTQWQERYEDARALNERLYQTLLQGVPFGVPITKLNWRVVQAEMSANTHRFWYARGYRIRTRTDAEKTTLTVWLEPKPATRSKTGATMRVAKTVGPAVPCVCVDCGKQTERKRAWGDFSLGTCRTCGGDLVVRPKVRDVLADAKAKRELAEQDGAA